MCVLMPSVLSDLANAGWRADPTGNLAAPKTSPPVMSAGGRVAFATYCHAYDVSQVIQPHLLQRNPPVCVGVPTAGAVAVSGSNAGGVGAGGANAGGANAGAGAGGANAGGTKAGNASAGVDVDEHAGAAVVAHILRQCTQLLRDTSCWQATAEAPCLRVARIVVPVLVC
jgi:hypothetical protein